MNIRPEQSTSGRNKLPQFGAGRASANNTPFGSALCIGCSGKVVSGFFAQTHVGLYQQKLWPLCCFHLRLACTDNLTMYSSPMSVMLLVTSLWPQPCHWHHWPEASCFQLCTAWCFYTCCCCCHLTCFLFCVCFAISLSLRV